MTVRFNTRLGIGFDIEHNEVNCYHVRLSDGQEGIIQFDGLIIKVPFLSIEIGNYYEVTEFEESEGRTLH